MTSEQSEQDRAVRMKWVRKTEDSSTAAESSRQRDPEMVPEMAEEHDNEDEYNYDPEDSHEENHDEQQQTVPSMSVGRWKGFGQKVLHVKPRTWEVLLDLKRKHLDARSLATGLSDGFYELVCSKLADVQPQEDVVRYFDLDISDNEICPEATQILIAFILKLNKAEPPICVRSIRAFKNQIGDEGCAHLAELIISQPFPISEIHLSHNKVSGLGAACVVFAAGAAFGVYPYAVQPKCLKFTGIWMRLEQNDVQAPDALVTAIQATPLVDGSVRLQQTSWSDREWGPNRSPSWATSYETTPQVVLYLFELQSKANFGQTIRETAAAKQAAREEVQQAKQIVLDIRRRVGEERGISELSDACEDTSIAKGSKEAKGKGKAKGSKPNTSSSTDQKHERKDESASKASQGPSVPEYLPIGAYTKWASVIAPFVSRAPTKPQQKSGVADAPVGARPASDVFFSIKSGNSWSTTYDGEAQLPRSTCAQGESTSAAFARAIRGMKDQKDGSDVPARRNKSGSKRKDVDEDDWDDWGDWTEVAKAGGSDVTPPTAQPQKDKDKDHADKETSKPKKAEKLSTVVWRRVTVKPEETLPPEEPKEPTDDDMSLQAPASPPMPCGLVFAKRKDEKDEGNLSQKPSSVVGKDEGAETKKDKREPLAAPKRWEAAGLVKQQQEEAPKPKSSSEVLLPGAVPGSVVAKLGIVLPTQRDKNQVAPKAPAVPGVVGGLSPVLESFVAEAKASSSSTMTAEVQPVEKVKKPKAKAAKAKAIAVPPEARKWEVPGNTAQVISAKAAPASPGAIYIPALRSGNRGLAAILGASALAAFEDAKNKKGSNKISKQDGEGQSVVIQDGFLYQ